MGCVAGGLASGSAWCWRNQLSQGGAICQSTTNAGPLGCASEDINVVDAQPVQMLRHAPNAASLPQHLQQLCDLANRSEQAEPFVHPVIRAILLHFMLGHDHPFIDGNGRTTRLLFYWSMARSGCCLMEYVSISHLLRQAPAK